MSKTEIAHWNITPGTIASRDSILQHVHNFSIDAGGIVESNIAANGYVKFSNGLKIIWGEGSQIKASAHDNAFVQQNFHTSFTTACYFVICCFRTYHVKDTGKTADDPDLNVACHIYSWEKSKFKYFADLMADQKNCMGSPMYLAIGKD